MRNTLILVTMVAALLLCVGPTMQAQGTNPDPVTLLYKTCVNSTVDTAFYYALNNFDLYGFNVQADSVMAADVYFDYTSTPGGKYTTYSDSCIVAATTGGAAARALRTWSAEKIPMGCDQLRIRVSKRAAANGGATKYYRLTIAGIKTH